MTLHSKQISDYIFVDKCIPDSICDLIKNELNSSYWEKHQWGSTSGSPIQKEDSLEPDVTYSKSLDSILKTFVEKTAKKYEELHSDKTNKNTSQFIFSISEIRFNRYYQDQKMEMHFDHIKSLFDGINKGIPAVSFVGALNDDYDGGELVFWEDYSIKLKKGEVVCFPSNFMYQHRVNPILNGVRDTFVCWAW